MDKAANSIFFMLLIAMIIAGATHFLSQDKGQEQQALALIAPQTLQLDVEGRVICSPVPVIITSWEVE